MTGLGLDKLSHGQHECRHSLAGAEHTLWFQALLLPGFVLTAWGTRGWLVRGPRSKSKACAEPADSNWLTEPVLAVRCSSSVDPPSMGMARGSPSSPKHMPCRRATRSAYSSVGWLTSLAVDVPARAGDSCSVGQVQLIYLVTQSGPNVGVC